MTYDGLDTSNFSMLDLFRMEVEEQAAILSQNLLAIENQPQSVTELEALMRAAHSIKGAARIVDLDGAVQIAHIMEDCFVAAQNGTVVLDADSIDVLLSGVDFLLNLSQVNEAELEGWLSQQEEDIQALEQSIGEMVLGNLQNRETEEMPVFDPSISLREELFSAQTEEPESAAHREDEEGQPHQTEEIPTPEPILESEEDPLTETEEDSSSPTKDSPPEGDRDPDDRDSSLVPTDGPSTIASTREADRTAQILSHVQQSLSATEVKDRVVKVSAENLNRIIGLAGESLVEANWLEPFADSLLRLKKRQGEILDLLTALQESLTGSSLPPTAEKVLHDVREKGRQCQEILVDRLDELDLFARRSANLSDSLYRAAIASHMRPFEDGVSGFYRMVRDLAKNLKKKAQLEIVGKSTQVDRDILDKLEAPITHILRNAIDHGIEMPDERREAGKPEQGQICLEATHRSGMLCVTVSDDGRGIDLAKLRGKVVDKGLVTQEMAARLTEGELMEFLFLPGFSTTDRVTEISGRGVGLDIAKEMVHEVGGTLRAVSKPGQGLSFHFQLPLTLSVIRTLIVEISGEPYAFPLTRLDRILRVNPAEIYLSENRQYFNLNNEENIGLISAYQVLDLPSSQPQSEALSVIVVADHNNRYGLVVDRFLGERDLVVRPLDPRLGKVPDISAAALKEDGSLVLIVDVADLVRSIETLLASQPLSHVTQDGGQSEEKPRKKILVVDDSITVREMERKLLENNGYQIEVAVNGMEGWNTVRSERYDLVITDVDMPRMNGIELTSQIKNHASLKFTPVIIVSYKDRKEDRLRGLDAGANYYLTKSSFHDDTLVKAVRDLIGT